LYQPREWSKPQLQLCIAHAERHEMPVSKGLNGSCFA
jgi:hypothetical protein